MAYYGVVRGNVIRLIDGEELAEGTMVEVRVIMPENIASPDERAEEVFRKQLLEAGLISEIKRPTLVPLADRRPVEVEGTPLSQTIIEERR